MTRLEVKRFIKLTLIPHTDYEVTTADPAVGIIYLKNNFISGHLRLLGKGGGAYPHKYLEMIEALFGKAEHAIEVCSGYIPSAIDLTTVDSHFTGADIVCDAQTLDNIASNKFDRWRCDPPYNERTAKEMYNCEMPSLIKLLKAGARVVKKNSLLFLLCTQNYQHHPPSLKRIGLIMITVVPNNEIRALNIYVKL